eukprot:11980334-Alexandrium_andersonii.AAC.1
MSGGRNGGRYVKAEQVPKADRANGRGVGIWQIPEPLSAPPGLAAHDAPRCAIPPWLLRRFVR